MWGGWLVGGGALLLLLLLLLPPYYTQTLHPKPSTLNNTGKYLEKVISSLIKDLLGECRASAAEGPRTSLLGFRALGLGFRALGLGFEG